MCNYIPHISPLDSGSLGNPTDKVSQRNQPSLIHRCFCSIQSYALPCSSSDEASNVEVKEIPTARGNESHPCSIPSPINSMLRQSLQRRCHSFTRTFSSIPANVSPPSAPEAPTYDLKEVARRKRRAEWKRRQGVRHVQPNPPTSPLNLFYNRDKRFSTI